jgi:ubiquinone/menaquinone biosynthesis C-methylase UbiE
MELTRKPFQGVLNILSFNRHFYIAGFLVLALIVLCSLIFHWPNNITKFIVIGFSYGLLMPLLISAFIYDFSGYYNLKWIERLELKDTSHTQIININAGFDETSYLLKRHFKNSNLQVFDFYNPKNHTEPAIVRARKISNVFPNTQCIETDTLPLQDNSVDLIFLLSSAHEIRSYKEKVTFFKECKRVCKPEGKIIMTEHLRDIPNFLAFSIGFTHFFSKKTWLKAYSEAGFSSMSEIKFTPFMSIFNVNI